MSWIKDCWYWKTCARHRIRNNCMFIAHWYAWPYTFIESIEPFSSIGSFVRQIVWLTLEHAFALICKSNNRYDRNAIIYVWSRKCASVAKHFGWTLFILFLNCGQACSPKILTHSEYCFAFNAHSTQILCDNLVAELPVGHHGTWFNLYLITRLASRL